MLADIVNITSRVANVPISLACCPQVAYTFLSGSFAPGAITHTANWATLPLVFGIMTFCYSGHGVFPSIQKSMKEPQKFPQVRPPRIPHMHGGMA